MSHTWVNGLNGAWYNTYVPQLSDYTALDVAFSDAINGDGGSNGSAWTPSANVVVQGAGMWAAFTPWIITGTASAKTAGGNPFTLGDNDYFLYGSGHPARTRTILQGFLGADFVNNWTINTGNPVGMESTATGAQIILPLRVHQGSQITSVALRFQENNGGGPPDNLMKFRVCKKDGLGNVTPLATSGVDGQGFISPASFTGGLQTITYTCDVGIVIDKATYSYFAEIQDEDGSGSAAGNIYISALATFSDILDNRPS